MNRRDFLYATAAAPASKLAAQPDLPSSKLKITDVRLVGTKPRRQAPAYKPAATSWSTQNVEVANPMSIYPEYKATRSLFFPDAGKMPGFTVEITTDKGIRGYGNGGAGGEDPFEVRHHLWWQG